MNDTLDDINHLPDLDNPCDSSASDETFYSIEEANQLIPELSLLFLQIQQMQTLIQANFSVVKRKNMDFSLSNYDKLVKTYDKKSDEEAIDAISSIKLLITQIQQHIKTITDKNLSIESIERGCISFPYQHAGDTVWLKWQMGETRITEWSTEKYDGEQQPLSLLLTETV